MNHRLIAIIETIILLVLVGAFIVYILSRGNAGNFSLITGR